MIRAFTEYELKPELNHATQWSPIEYLVAIAIYVTAISICSLSSYNMVK